jgi:hypothetical protein
MGECLCDEDGPCREHRAPLRFDGGSPAARGGVRELQQFGPPVVDIALDRALRKGIAQQMRALADVLDPPS